MAIKDTSRKPFIQDNDTNVKIGIDLPIRRGDDLDGFFASTSTTIEAVKNNIRNLLQTEEGERFFQPNLGIGLRRLLFEHITNENLIGIQDVILDKFEFWLPFVEIRNIEVLNRDNTTDIGVNEIRIKIIQLWNNRLRNKSKFNELELSILDSIQEKIIQLKKAVK